jgi:hypothetical protein
MATWPAATVSTPLARTSKPGSIRDSATPFGLMDLDLDFLRA